MIKQPNKEPNLWEAIGNWFEKVWFKIKNPNKAPTFFPPVSEDKSQWEKNSEEREKLKSDAIGNVTKYIKPKTFDEWLSDQKLSRDDKNENYFGNFYKKTAKSLVEQAYNNKQNTIQNATQIASRAGTASHNAYDAASSKFSNGSERMFSNGLKNSGFSNYLNGISYLAYRDEISKTTNSKLDAVATANNNYSNSTTQIENEQAKQISDREKELLKLYLDSVGQNKNISAGLAK